MKGRIQEFFSAWLLVLVLNQIFIFHGCFALYCLLPALPHTGLLAFLWVKFTGKPSEPPISNEKVQPQSAELKKDREQKKAAAKQAVEKYQRENVEQESTPKPDPLKEKGDRYERFIGAEFEKKGDLVIYNGFIKGYEDQGVDLISISNDSQTINLIQCKNWTKMRMSLAHMEDVYAKLDRYDFDCLSFPSYQVDAHLASKNNDTYAILLKAKNELPKLVIRKTLFIASEKVVDLEVGPYLTMMAPTIFRYKDMKIVMKESG